MSSSTPQSWRTKTPTRRSRWVGRVNCGSRGAPLSIFNRSKNAPATCPVDLQNGPGSVFSILRWHPPELEACSCLLMPWSTAGLSSQTVPFVRLMHCAPQVYAFDAGAMRFLATSSIDSESQETTWMNLRCCGPKLRTTATHQSERSSTSLKTTGTGNHRMPCSPTGCIFSDSMHAWRWSMPPINGWTSIRSAHRFNSLMQPCKAYRELVCSR